MSSNQRNKCNRFNFFERNNTQTKIIVELLFDFDISNKWKKGLAIFIMMEPDS